jgi:predicted nucleic acid-binding protein
MQLVFLDTNVVLSGALAPGGPASSLVRSRDEFRFIYSDRVIEECNAQINRWQAPDRVVVRARKSIDDFLRDLSAERIPDKPFPGVQAHDPDDQVILETACHEACSYICTYDYTDFPSDLLLPCAPLSLRRQAPKEHKVGTPMSDDEMAVFIQEASFSQVGTLMIYAQFWKFRYPFALLYADDFNLYVGSDNHIVCEGSVVKDFKQLGPLDNRLAVIVIRYKDACIEALRWQNPHEIHHLSTCDPEVIFRARCSRLINVCSAPPTEWACQFYLLGFSGVPRYLNYKALRAAIGDGSLERGDSIDVRQALLLDQQFYSGVS